MKKIWILILSFSLLFLFSCYDNETDESDNTETTAPETVAIDYAAEYEKRADQVGYQSDSKYRYTEPVITEIKDYIPPEDQTIMLVLDQNKDSKFLTSPNGDTYYFDSYMYEKYNEWYDYVTHGNKSNGIIKISPDGEKERICVVDDCSVDSICTHMNLGVSYIAATDNALYFIVDNYAMSGRSAYILEYDLTSKEFTKIADIECRYSIAFNDFIADGELLFITYDFGDTGGLYVIDIQNSEMYVCEAPGHIYGIVKGELLTCLRDYDSYDHAIKLYDPLLNKTRTITETSRSSDLWAVDEYVIYTDVDENSGMEDTFVYNINSEKKRKLGHVSYSIKGNSESVYFRTNKDEDCSLYSFSPSKSSEKLDKIAVNVSQYYVYKDNVLYIKRGNMIELEYLTWDYNQETQEYSPITRTRYAADPVEIYLFTGTTSTLLWESDGIHISALADTFSGNALYTQVLCPGDEILDRIPSKYLRIPLGSSKVEIFDELWE